jgi:hypothetical protein
MAWATEIMGGGFSPGQATALGGSTNSAVASAGTTQGTATLIGSSFAVVTGADGNKGVILPALNPGDEGLLFNSSTSTLKLYPPTGAAIAVPGTGLGSANASFAVTANKYVQYNCFSSTQFFVMVTA